MNFAFFDLLKNDDILSPIAFVCVGILGLAWFQIMRIFTRDAPEKILNHPLFRATFARFESRTRLSWILLVFGALWLMQALVEKSWAGQ